MSKYTLHEGYVYSADGDRHFIPASRLAALYKVNIQDCKIVRYRSISTYSTVDTINLYPRNDGNYKLPEVKK